MGIMTISIDDDVEQQFRELAQKIYSKKKGYLGNAVTSSMKKWIDEISQKQILERDMKLIENGFDMGDFLLSSGMVRKSTEKNNYSLCYQ